MLNGDIESSDPWSSFNVPKPQEYIIQYARRKDPVNVRRYERNLVTARDNTLKAYFSKQTTYLKWCSWKHSIEPVMGNVYDINPERFEAFIAEVVETRTSRDMDGQSISVKPSTKLAYVDALLHLWRLQINVEHGGRPSHNPKDEPCVVSYKRQLSSELADFKILHNVDRIQGTALEMRVNIRTYKEKSVQYLAASESAEVKWHFAFLSSWNGLLRGESVRRFQFADLAYMQEQLTLGPQKVDILVLLQSKGKVNHDGRTDVYPYLRHDDWTLCVHGALARLFFDRFEIKGNAWPSFNKKEEWFGTYLVCEYSTPFNPITYQGHRKAVLRANRNVHGNLSRTKTHEGRRGGAQIADMFGASEESIRRAGHWNASVVSTRYMDPICRESMMALAGFDKSKTTYYLKRDILEPPESLKNLLWPIIDEWRRKLADNQIEQPCSSLHYFLDALVHLRKVFLQDAVFLQEVYPNHYFFRHPLFHLPEWTQFKASLLQAIRDDDTPITQSFQNVAPQIASSIQDLTRAVHQTQDMITKRDEKTDSVNNKVLNLVTKFAQDFTNIHAETTGAVGQELVQNPSRVHPRDEGVVTDIPRYTMSRQVVTVTGLWTEWMEGINGGPAVRDLEENFGARWRSNATERAFFYRRKSIIKYVIHYASEHTIDESEAVARVEDMRKSMKLKLNGFADYVQTLSL